MSLFEAIRTQRAIRRFTDDPVPDEAIERILEAAIRAGDLIDESSFAETHPYWADLIRLLLVFREAKHENWDAVRRLRQRMASDVYDPFIGARLDHAS